MMPISFFSAFFRISALLALAAFTGCLLSGCEKSKGQELVGGDELATHALAFSKHDTLSPEEIKQARFIISSSDCMACHSEDRRLSAPSYTEIANRYAQKNNAVGYLSKKIINGGVGKWGQIPMPSRTNISKEEATLLARYILMFNPQQ